MSEAGVGEANSAPRDLAIDPFSFLPGVASQIVGLGGNAPGHDPTYVFHTPYVQVAPGPATFTIRFGNLAAKRGSIYLRLHMLPIEPGGHARLVNSERIALNRLAAQGGEIRIAFEAYRGVTFAVLGQMVGESDASADKLEVTLDRPHDGSGRNEAADDARSTTFGIDAVRPAVRLISTEPATLANPVSQMCTADQFDEPAYAMWAGRIRQPPRRDRRQWELVYTMQVLERYGMLLPGARGLGFGCGTEPLPALIASMGVDVVATDLAAEQAGSAPSPASRHDDGAGDGPRHPDVGYDTVSGRDVSLRRVDMTMVPTDLVNFDFVWSAGAYEHLGSIQAGLQFVESAIACLRPGGLAVHTSAFNLSSDEDTLESDTAVLFRRRDMERLALRLISLGHEVAQVKLNSGNRPLDDDAGRSPRSNRSNFEPAASRYAVTSFGIIIRKARSAL